MKTPYLDGIRRNATEDLKEGREMFNSAEIELFLKTRGKYFENNEEVNPRYGIIYSISDSEDGTIKSVGVVDFPFDFSNPKLPSGHDIVLKKEVVANTRKGIRYTTIIKTISDPWMPGQLVHTDGDKHLSTNPNDTSKDNLKNLALGDYSNEEVCEILKRIKES